MSVGPKQSRVRLPPGKLGPQLMYVVLIRRGLRRDTGGSYQGVGTSGGLASFVLPLSKCLVHRDSEFDRRVPRWRIVSVDRELVMG